MPVKGFRIQNFMCFADSGWVELRPLTLFYGYNSAGKSAFLRSLLLLRQTLRLPNRGQSLAPNDSPSEFMSDEGLTSLDVDSYSALVRDHEPGRCMSFWFECDFNRDSKRPEVVTALEGLGIKPTVQVRLSYGLHNQQVTLQEVALYDEGEALIINASAPQAEPSALKPWHFEADFFREQPANSWPLTALVVKEGFFPQFHVLSSQSDVGAFGHIQQLLCHCKRSIEAFFNSLEYVGPRGRNYLVSQGLGANGLTAFLLDKQRIKQVNQWLAQFGFQVHLEVKALAHSENKIQLLFSDASPRRNPPFQTSIRDVGLGLSQILPLLARTLLAPENSTLLIEHPERNLHPRSHSRLGDLLIYVAVRRKVRLLIETHSENLLIRMRRRVAESTRGYVSASEKSYLPLSDLKVYFVDDRLGPSQVAELGIGEMGEIFTGATSFNGFFSDDLRDTVSMGKARLGV